MPVGSMAAAPLPMMVMKVLQARMSLSTTVALFTGPLMTMPVSPPCAVVLCRQRLL